MMQGQKPRHTGMNELNIEFELIVSSSITRYAPEQPCFIEGHRIESELSAFRESISGARNRLTEPMDSQYVQDTSDCHCLPVVLWTRPQAADKCHTLIARVRLEEVNLPRSGGTRDPADHAFPAVRSVIVPSHFAVQSGALNPSCLDASHSYVMMQSETPSSRAYILFAMIRTPSSHILACLSPVELPLWTEALPT
jgi:hypothetical protein